LSLFGYAIDHTGLDEGVFLLVYKNKLKEIFLGNLIRLLQALDQANQTVKLNTYEGMPHVFVPTLPESAESRAAIAKVRDWGSEHLLAD